MAGRPARRQTTSGVRTVGRKPEDLPGDLNRQPAGGGADSEGDRAGGGTVLAFPLGSRLGLFLGLPAIGVLVGLALPPIARWALGLGTGLPVRPVFRLVGAADRPLEVLVPVTIGLAFGLAAALAAYGRNTTVTVTDDEVQLKREEETRTIARADVAAAFLDGKRLVLLDPESRQLARDLIRAPSQEAARAFRAHGYPWQDADPFHDLYHRWTPHAANLPAEVNALLAAREAALKKKATQEVRDLREAVQGAGYVVREEGTRQFWRPLVRS